MSSETTAANNADAKSGTDSGCSAKSYCLVALYVLSAVWGGLQIVCLQNAFFAWAFALLFASLITFWASIDAKLRGQPMLHIVQALFLFTWPLAALVYLVATRRWRGLGLWALNAFGLFATMCVFFYPTLFLAYWIGWGVPTGP